MAETAVRSLDNHDMPLGGLVVVSCGLCSQATEVVMADIRHATTDMRGHVARDHPEAVAHLFADVAFPVFTGPGYVGLPPMRAQIAQKAG